VVAGAAAFGAATLAGAAVVAAAAGLAGVATGADEAAEGEAAGTEVDFLTGIVMVCVGIGVG